MNRQILLSEKDKIFATGVFLRPALCTINGIKQWRWVSDGFIDDSYYCDDDDNADVIDVYDYADDLQGLLIDS